MCGIVAYLGEKDAQPILLDGLKRLEYRGYDSAGVAFVRHGKLAVHKTAGRIADLEKRLAEDADDSGAHQAITITPGKSGNGHGREPAPWELGPRLCLGIAHTRWATHGAPNSVNAHPHTDCKNRLALVHNGIIENHAALKEYLLDRGHRFAGQTDTEVLAHLIEEFYKGDLESAVRQALQQVTGTYGLAVICVDEPGTLVAARNGSPLIVGVGTNEFVVASDASAIVRHTKQVIYLSDREVVGIRPGRLHVGTLDNVEVTKQVEDCEFSLEQIEKNGFEHFMLKEIFEQPESLARTLAGRVDAKNGAVVLGGPGAVAKELVRARRIIVTGCGTALHAGMVGEYLLEELARVPVEVESAGEFRYKNPIVEDGTVVVAISQSGETADTLAALREAKLKGALTLGVVNVVGSTIAREVDAGVYLHAGPEIGVASTKAFTSQVTVAALLGIFFGRRRHLSPAAASAVLEELTKIPGKIRTILDQSDRIREIAGGYVERNNWLYLGRGYNYPVALEGALKLKEISYIHAEGMAAAEMKHGPIALITEGTPVVFIAPQCAQYEKAFSNIEEVRCRGGEIIAVATEGDKQIGGKTEHVIHVPPTIDCLQPLLTVIPLQLMAYHAAVLLGRDVDKPRNLAKSVTVE
jgi:glucosamine--fructose-6-phosphate aminotransferase (isomerizing)